MKYSEFITVIEVSDVHDYFIVYKNGIELTKWNYELIKDLEVIKVKLETCPYAIKGIIVHIYLEEPVNEIR